MKNKPAVTAIEPGDATFRRRTVLGAGAVVGLFGLLGWRLIHLQVGQHGHYKALVEEKYERVDVLEAHRGRIFDTRGKLLASDEPVQRICFNIGYLKEKDWLAAAISEAEKTKTRDLLAMLDLPQLQQRYLDHVVPLLAKYAGRDEAGIRTEIMEKAAETGRKGEIRGELVIGREVSIHNGLQLREELETAKLGKYSPMLARIGAVIFRDAFVRRYPLELNLAHLAGLTALPPGNKPGDQPCGVTGLERFFEDKLKGRPGQRIIQIDGKGQELAAYRGDVTPPQHGANLRATFDTGLMELVERELDAPGSGPDDIGVPEMNPNRVIVVLFEPKTMALRAAVTRDFTGKKNPGTSDLVEYVYEPGSTIKIGTIGAALSEGKVGPATMVSLNNGVYTDDEVGTIRDEHAYPELSVEGIMVHSSNIGAFKLARQIGLNRYREYLDALGFVQRTGIELPIEARGRIAKPWNMMHMSRCSFGYTFSVTPAQMCSLMGCVLNDGMWSPLRTTEAWTDEQNRTQEEISGPAPRRVFKERAAKQVQQMLLQTVEKGTGKLARSDYYEIGGKTGTARKYNPAIKDYDSKKRIVSFLGYIAAGDGPRLAGIVIIDEPKLSSEQNYGGRLPAPLFRRIAEKAMNYYEVPALFAVNDAPGKAVKKTR